MTLKTPSPHPPPFSKLTTRGLHLHLQTPLSNLRVLAQLTSSVSPGYVGGELTTILSMHAEHGDPYRRRVVESIIERASRPIYHMIQRWVREGELGGREGASTDDAEFFVAEDPSVSNDDLYGFRYNLNPRMLIPSISPALAKKILGVGRNINFLRRCCAEAERGDTTGGKDLTSFVPGVHFTSDALRKAFTYGNSGVLEKVVGAAFKETSKHILTVIKEEVRADL